MYFKDAYYQRHMASYSDLLLCFIDLKHTYLDIPIVKCHCQSLCFVSRVNLISGRFCHLFSLLAHLRIHINFFQSLNFGTLCTFVFYDHLEIQCIYLYLLHLINLWDATVGSFVVTQLVTIYQVMSFLDQQACTALLIVLCHSG